MDSYEYRDAELSVQVPSYLHPKKGLAFFEARSKKDRRHPLLHVAVGVLDDCLFDAKRETMMRMTPGAVDECLGVQRRVIRRGELSHLADALELLVSSHNPVTGQVQHDYGVSIRLDSRRVFADFLGQGELGQFEDACRQILANVRLAEGGGPAPVIAQRGRVAGAMRRADKLKLKNALDGLPPEIAYLRRPILALPSEDQDLLGSGEADVESVGRALEQVAKPESIEATANAHAQILHDWLMSLPDLSGAWARPIAYVEGVLRGRAIWG
jgi:hypothetical protein